MKYLALCLIVVFGSAASCERSQQPLATCVVNDLQKGSPYHESGKVVSQTQTLPGYLEKITLQSSGPGVFYRTGEINQMDANGHLTTTWSVASQPTIDTALLKGKLIQFALEESLFASTPLTWKFHSAFSRYFGSKWVPREEWCARQPRPDIDQWKQKWNVFAVHHTAGSSQSSPQVVKGIQNFHMDTRGWSDIAYHFLIGNDGKVYEGRSLLFQGADVRGHNTYTIGLSALGCYDAKECGKTSNVGALATLTPELTSAFASLIGTLAYLNRDEISSIDRKSIQGHLQFPGASTVCPGSQITEKLDAIIDEAQETFLRLSSNPQAPPL